MTAMEILVVLVGILSTAFGRPDGGYNYEAPSGHGGGGSEPVIQKHIYVHVPPPDPEFHAPPQRVVPAPPPKKHYKIVFIKAPTYAPPAAPVIPEIPQNQEKTLIYVLHKNPSDAPPIVIPTAKPTQPSKPEVYFIRYKTQKEVGYAGGQDGGHGGGAAGGGHGGHGAIIGGHGGGAVAGHGGGHGALIGGGHGSGHGGGVIAGVGVLGHGLSGHSHDSGYSPSSPSSTAVYSSSTAAPVLSSPRAPFLRVRTATPKFVTPTPTTS
ncbi:uncharacterized protein [Halyomorpha halys]|uniref:uncharacterized protein n=1 Tax=Halyomorpha halys TaxID=286706 RepID=UPI0006D4D1BB|nr:larval cuticle protein F1 [Halyomorpha halys]KAE8573532.1 Cuticle Protein Tweedle [Halyomorpha halys]